MIHTRCEFEDDDVCSDIMGMTMDARIMIESPRAQGTGAMSESEPGTDPSMYNDLSSSSRQDGDRSPSKRQRHLGMRRLAIRRNNKQERAASEPNEAATAVVSPMDPFVNSMDSSSSSAKSRLRLLPSFLRRSGAASSPTNSSLRRNKSRSKESKASSKGTAHTEESDLESCLPSLMDRTKIVTEQLVSPSSRNTTPTIPEVAIQEEQQVTSLATVILGHNYLERLCGVATNESFDEIHSSSKQPRILSEDPTVQESIECIFASQLQEGLGLWDEDGLEDVGLNLIESRDDHADPNSMVSPSLLQQSRQNRSDRLATSMSHSKKRYDQASLVYVGTFDPTIPDAERVILENKEGPVTCSCADSNLPALEPSRWPQAPLLLRPTPGRGTRVKGVRMGMSKEYLWEPASHLSWSECLAKKWGVPCKPAPRVGCCERCATLPINNGNEAEGESLIIDFESDLFEGSLLLRLRFCNGSTMEPYDDNKGYFKGMNRRYQAVIRGRFKKAIPLTELSTGFKFDRPCGKLPAKWILRGGIKVLSFFAPQLDAKMEGHHPHSLTPLGSTPQSISVDDHDDDAALGSMEKAHEEPVDARRTLLGEKTIGTTSLQRARARKKAFDKLFVQKSKEPKTDPTKVYTFEFLQHLFNFQEFSVELGNMLGSVQLESILDGQPLQLMAAHEEKALWSFDLWHECLWKRACELEQSGKAAAVHA